MSDLQRRRRGGLSRNARANRAYTLTKVASGLLIATIVLIVLAIFTSVSLGWAVVTGALTVGAGVALRRTVSR